MSTSASSDKQRLRLPTEIILSIFERAIDKHVWQIDTLVNVNTHLRSSLYRRLISIIHLHSFEKIDDAIRTVWPPSSSAFPKELYLHFLHRWEDGDAFYDGLLGKLQGIPPPTREDITTLGMRTAPTPNGYNSLGIWTCNLLPKLKRLCVDATLLWPLGGTETHEELDRRLESLPDPNTRLSTRKKDEWPIDMVTRPSQIEAYALAGMSMRVLLGKGDLEAPHERRQFIKETFPHLKRLYLFTLASYECDMIRDDTHSVVMDFDEVTNVKLIVHVIIQEGSCPSSGPAPEACFVVSPNGAIFLKNIIVEKSSSQE